MGKNVLNSVMTLPFNQDLANIRTAKDEHFHSIFKYFHSAFLLGSRALELLSALAK